MSSYLDNLITSAEQGAANEREVVARPMPTSELPVTPDEPIFPDGFEAVEADESYPILGNVTGIGAEIGTGLYLTKKFHKSQQFLKWAGRVKNVSMAGVVAPEPATSLAGLGGVALTEAAIWGASNLIGQNIRKQFGVQDDISGGEVLASAVFGVGLATKAGTKLVSLGDGLAQMKSWGKGNELFINGTKSFVSGATLGLAETALRQEVQLILNERENRDAMEYLIGGAAGGGFNTLFDVFSRTGKWGQGVAKKSVAKTKESLENQIEVLEARLNDKATHGLSGQKRPTRAGPSIRRKIRQIRKAIDLTDDLGKQIEVAAENLNNPKPTEAPATKKPEEEPKKEPKRESNEAPAPKKPEEEPKPTAEESVSPTSTQLSPRQQEIDTLYGSLKDLDNVNMSKEMPRIEREAKKIYTSIYDDISVVMREFTKNEPIKPEDQAQLLDLVKDLRNLNQNVKDVVETTAGRSLQAARRDADKYHWADSYSLRSQQEDANLALLEDTLSNKIDTGEEASEIFEEFVGVKPKLKEDGKKLRAKEKAETKKKETTPEQQAAKVKKQKKLEDDKFRLQLFTDIENAFYKSLDADTAGAVTKSFRWIAQSRQLALINQLPSALAGVPTGTVALIREVNRSVSNYTANKFAGNPLAGELAKVDLNQSINNFSYLFSGDNWRAVGRTLKENQSATDPRKAGRMEDTPSRVSMPRGDAALVASAKRRAQKALSAQKSLINKAGRKEGAEPILERLDRLYFLGQSGGVRLIQGLDEAFKRPLILGRVRASARKEAILELHANKTQDGIDYTPKDIDELAQAKYDNALMEADGLMVLRATHEYVEEGDLARQELLFAANSDNVSEVVAPYSEKVVQAITGLTGDDHPISFGINAVAPYVGVPIRGAYKGGSWLTATPRSLGMLTGNNVGLNPYVGKIKEAQNELAIIENLKSKRADSPFDDKGLEATNTFDVSIAETLEKIERLEARRIQYNSDTLADALMTVELGGIMALAALASAGTGSMTFLKQDQTEKLGLTGVKPFNIFGMDYKAIGPAAFPLTVVGDLVQWQRIKKAEAQTGQVILDEDLAWYDVITKSIISLAKEQPLSSGAKQVTEMAGSDEQRKVAFSSMLSSYGPLPAQLKKAIQQANNKGRMVDLKGSTFADRVAYGVLGMGISNYKTDYFGYDVEDPRGFIQNNIMRQWPTAKKTKTMMDQILGSDLRAEIQRKPEHLSLGVRLKDYVDERGISLTYQFDQVLKETKINGKTMLDAVQEKIYDNNWQDSFYASSSVENNALINEGLKELNTLMRSYYEKTQKEIIKDVFITSRFINKNEETLTDSIKKFESGEFLKDSGPVDLGEIFQAQ